MINSNRDERTINMHMNEEGLKLLKSFEGCVLNAYQDVIGIWTIGWGHTANVKPGDKITQEQADKMLIEDLSSYEAHVIHNCNNPMNENEFSALTDFCYNCGSGNLKTLVRGRSNNQIAEAILLYDKAGGKHIKALSNRRHAERELFLKPVKA